MVTFAEIRILAADVRPPRGQFRVDEGADHGDDPAHEPCAENQNREMNLPCDGGRIDEDARTDDPSHYDHRRVEQAEPPGQAGFCGRAPGIQRGLSLALDSAPGGAGGNENRLESWAEGRGGSALLGLHSIWPISESQ